MITQLSFNCELELSGRAVECSITYSLDSDELKYCGSVVPVLVDVRCGQQSIAHQIVGIPDREQMVDAACRQHYERWRKDIRE